MCTTEVEPRSGKARPRGRGALHALVHAEKAVRNMVCWSRLVLPLTAMYLTSLAFPRRAYRNILYGIEAVHSLRDNHDALWNIHERSSTPVPCRAYVFDPHSNTTHLHQAKPSPD
jgi:hypothetical protein